MRKKIVLSETRDIPLLKFLWRWKVSTTAALSNKFFPDSSPTTAYKRLWKLENAGFIQTKSDNKCQKFIWTLDQKGYYAIQDTIPKLKVEGYSSESVAHDLFVSAFQIGDWLISSPKGVRFFTEQELRRYYFDSYPEWVPRTDTHRADGYSRVQIGNSLRTIAFEVELNQKRNVDYENVASFYSKLDNVHRVFWLVPYRSMAVSIQSAISSQLKSKSSIHNFVSLTDFGIRGWQSPIILGPELGISIGHFFKNGQETSSKPVSSMFLLDTRKAPHRSKSYEPFKHNDFSDRVGP